MRVAVTLRPGDWDPPEGVPEGYFQEWAHTIESVAPPHVDDILVFDAPGTLAKYVASWRVVSRTIDATRSTLAIKITCEPHELLTIAEDVKEGDDEGEPEDPDYEVVDDEGDDDLPI